MLPKTKRDKEPYKFPAEQVKEKGNQTKKKLTPQENINTPVNRCSLHISFIKQE